MNFNWKLFFSDLFVLFKEIFIFISAILFVLGVWVVIFIAVFSAITALSTFLLGSETTNMDIIEIISLLFSLMCGTVVAIGLYQFLNDFNMDKYRRKDE